MYKLKDSVTAEMLESVGFEIKHFLFTRTIAKLAFTHIDKKSRTIVALRFDLVDLELKYIDATPHIQDLIKRNWAEKE
jgi:hypothetical protein